MAEDKKADYLLEIEGRCPICEKDTRFVSKNRWLRGGLICTTCPGGSVPRERALAMVLERWAPNWRQMPTHESSPISRGISLKLRHQGCAYTGTNFHPRQPMGAMVGGFRNENLEEQTFADKQFGLVVTLDVFEHVFEPGKMMKEIFRTLMPGGLYICTFPIRPYQVDSHKVRAKLLPSGEVEHLEEPEYHGNPIDKKGSLVTFDYGYAIHQMIGRWAPFEVEISRFNKPSAGILGEYTEVIVCRKPD